MRHFYVELYLELVLFYLAQFEGVIRIWNDWERKDPE
jgi:hypothetical protein